MEFQETEVAKIPEIEDKIELTKQKQSEEVEHCDESQQQQQAQEAEEDVKNRDEEEDELRNLLLSDIGDLPICPPSATQINFVSYFITGSLRFSAKTPF